MTTLLLIAGLVIGFLVGTRWQRETRGQVVDVKDFIDKTTDFEEEYGHVPEYVIIVEGEYRYLTKEEEA